MPLLARLEAGGQGLQPQLLRVQYRMHPAIAEFASKQFYRGRVESGVSVEDRPLIKVGGLFGWMMVLWVGWKVVVSAAEGRFWVAL